MTGDMTTNLWEQISNLIGSDRLFFCAFSNVKILSVKPATTKFKKLEVNMQTLEINTPQSCIIQYIKMTEKVSLRYISVFKGFNKSSPGRADLNPSGAPTRSLLLLLNTCITCMPIHLATQLEHTFLLSAQWKANITCYQSNTCYQYAISFTF